MSVIELEKETDKIVSVEISTKSPKKKDGAENKKKKPPAKSRPQKFKILFLCTGNTCRSPMAEYILKDYLKKNKITKYAVSSAGLSVDEGDMTETAKIALANLRITFKKHLPRQLTQKIIDGNNMIVCMTESHRAAILNYASSKAHLFGDITGGGDVPDPYGQSLERYLKTAEYLMYGCADIITFAEKLCQKLINGEKTK